MPRSRSPVFVLSMLPLVVGCGAIQKRLTAEGVTTDQPAHVESSTPKSQAPGVLKVSKLNSPEASAEYHFALAQSYVAEGNPDRAIEEFRLATMHDPKSALILTRLGAEYVKKGAHSDAMDAFKKAIEIDPKAIDARLMLASLHSSLRDTEAALAEYERAIKIKPDSEEAHVYRAQALIELNRTETAARHLRAFVTRKDLGTRELPLAWYYLGRVEQRLGKTESSKAALVKALELRPHFSQASLALGMLYETQQNLDQALKVYVEGFQASQDPTLASRLTTLLLKAERFKEAVPYLEATIAADPEDMGARVKLGLVLMELKELDQSAQLFGSILEKFPDSDRVRFYLGNVRQEQGDAEQAIAEFVRVPADSKMYSDAILHAASLLKETGKVEESLKLVGESITKAPRLLNLYLYKASLEEERKDSKAALATLTAAEVYFPEDERLLYYLGTLSDQVGKADEALVFMERILKVNADNVDALNFLGYMWTLRGERLSDARKLLERAMKLKPGNPYIMDSWGWHLHVTGRSEEAVVALERAVAVKGDEPTILGHLADVYLALGLREKALATFERASAHAEGSEKGVLAQKISDLKEALASRFASPRPETGGRSPASR